MLTEQTLCTVFCEIQEFPYFFTKCALYLYEKAAFSIAHNKTVRQHEVIDRMSVEWWIEVRYLTRSLWLSLFLILQHCRSLQRGLTMHYSKR